MENYTKVLFFFFFSQFGFLQGSKESITVRCTVYIIPIEKVDSGFLNDSNSRPQTFHFFFTSLDPEELERLSVSC